MRHIFLILFMGLAVSVNAQIKFSLSQSIEYALKNHPSIAISQNNIGLAKEKARQSIAGYLPQLSASGNFIDNMKLQSSVLPAGILGPEPRTIEFGTKYNANAAIDLNQTIYDQSKLAGIKANKPYAEMIALQKEQDDETLVYNTAVAYFQVLIYQEQLALLKANKEKYEEMVRVLTYQHEKGTVLEKDVDRVRVNLNTTNYQIEDATTKERLAINTLKNAMGMPIDQPFTVVDGINYELFAASYGSDSISVMSLTAAKINQKSIELQKINVRIKQAAYLPTVSIVGKYATQALNTTFPDAFSNWSGYSYIGLSLNMPLFTGFKRKSMVKEEKLILANDIANFDINKKNLTLKFENAKTSVGTAYSSYQTNKENMALAKNLLSVTDYQYQQGVAGLTDYLNDDIAYKSAQSNYINSLYNLMISQLDYQKNQGTLLQFINKLK